MPLPTFLTRAELQEVEDRLSTLYEDINDIAATLNSAGELDLLAPVRTASGKIWKARAAVQNIRQTRKPPTVEG